MAAYTRQRMNCIIACALLLSLVACDSGQPAQSGNPGAGELATLTPNPSPSIGSVIEGEGATSESSSSADPPPSPSNGRGAGGEGAVPTPTPQPALHQLTWDGCCTQPFWSPDSRWVLFIDEPAPDTPAGIWGVDVTQPAPTPQLVTERIAFYTADLAYLVEVDQGATVIERLAIPLTGTVTARWTVPAGGRMVSISPGHRRIAWEVTDDNLAFERRTTQVWVANLDGGDARPISDLARGGFGGWVSDDVLLLSGREALQAREQVLYTFSLTDGRTTELARGERLRGGLLSPDGAWLAYFVALDQDPAQNGLWLVRTDGSARRRLDRDLFGAYHWRDAQRLLIIPFRPEAVSHELWELDVSSEEAHRLTDPAVTPFKIANGDWVVSPDGRTMAFVESRDHNLWLLTLP